MGIFSSKYVTNVGTTVARVVEDKALPDSVKHGAVTGLFDGGEQFIENVLESLVSSIGVKANRMYNYGKKKYLYGLPSGAMLSSNSGKELIRSTIAANVGQSVVLEYYHFGALNNLHLGWNKLIVDHGYNAKTNVLGNLTAAKGKPVKLTNIAVVVTEASLLELSNGSLDQWGPSPAGTVTGNNESDAALRKIGSLQKPKLFELDAAAANDYLRVEYTWPVDYTAVVEGVNVTRTRMDTGSFRIEIVGFDEEADWHQAKYIRADGEIGYWLYMAGTGFYPVIDALHDTAHSEENGSYFPFGYFRYNKVSGNADKNSEWFKQSKKLMGYVGIDYEAVTDAVHENPSINDVEQAMLMMAVPAITENQIEMRYLYDYFSSLLDLTGGDLVQPKPYQSGGSLSEMVQAALNPSQFEAGIVIEDKRFKMALGFSHISHKIVQGTVGDGKVDTYASGWGEDIQVVTGTNVAGGGIVSWSTPVKSHWYRRQTTPTQYEEIRVSNLKMTYHIFEKYTAVGDENDDILLIPLDRSITHKYSVPDREELYTRGMHYVFNSRVVTEVKWYQQGWFAYLLLIAAIIITIITYGESFELVISAWALGTLTLEAFVYMLAIGVLKYLAVQLAFKLFVKVVGVKLAIIIAIVAALAGGYQAIDAGSIQGAPWAQELLSISTNLSSGINAELKREFGQLKEEADAFAVFAKTEQKRLDEANKLLDDHNWMTPMIIFGEKPNDFYNRTVHSGNIGVLGLDAISAYVDVSLTLPKLTDTL